MLKFSLLGVLLVAITVIIHAVGTMWLVNRLARRFGSKIEFGRQITTLRILTGTIVVLTILHTVQIVIWAYAYLYLLPDNILQTFEEATYFSFVTFTTLGYGDITFDGAWRVLSGIEALNGVLLIGWSTALLFAVVQKTWKSAVQQNKIRQD